MTSQQINAIAEIITTEGHSINIWEKGQQSRMYINFRSSRDSMGYIDLNSGVYQSKTSCGHTLCTKLANAELVKRY